MRTVSSRYALIAGLAMSAALVGGFATDVQAHTEVDYTLPTDGASVGEPVAEITVAFTEAVTLVGPGFEVLDPEGNILTPFAVTDDDVVFRLQLEPPLGGGVVGVRYEVTSADGHVVSGAFSFTVSVPAPTTTTTPATTTPATTTPATTLPATDPTTTTSPSAPPGSSSGPTVATTATAPTPAPATSAPATATSVPDDEGDGSDTAWIYLAVAGVVIVGAAAFLIFRPKPPT
jgi:methionine-rich copper-binding protein CopC